MPRRGSLIVDFYMVQILQAVNLAEDTTTIIIQRDGSWTTDIDSTTDISWMMMKSRQMFAFLLNWPLERQLPSMVNPLPQFIRSKNG